MGGRAEIEVKIKMSESPTNHKTTKVVTLLFLLANYLLTANAAAQPLGAVELTVSKFYWILLIVVLAVLSMIYFLSKKDSPIEVVGLTYDKENNNLELTVRNSGSQSYNIKSALRLMQPAQDVIDQAVEQGNIPMAAAQASVGQRSLFQLLCEDDTPVMLDPNETKTLTYDLLVPSEYLNLDGSKNVEVHISYGEGAQKPQNDLKPEKELTPAFEAAKDVIEENLEQGPESYNVSVDADQLISESYLIEDLLSAVKNSPDEAISYHMSSGNDFASWVRNVVGDAELADELDEITFTDEAQTRQKLEQTLQAKLDGLRHPYLRNVGEQNKFQLKADHDNIIGEVLLLEELSEALANAPEQVIPFHMKQGNDFAHWVDNAVGDAQLAQRIRAISYTTPAETKDKIVSALRERVDGLKS